MEAWLYEYRHVENNVVLFSDFDGAASPYYLCYCAHYFEKVVFLSSNCGSCDSLILNCRHSLEHMRQMRQQTLTHA